MDGFHFVNQRTKGLCLCNVCGYEWYVTPDNLLHNHGCPNCKGLVVKSNDEMIELIKKVHPNVKWDFSLLEFKNANAKMDIICNEVDENGCRHGLFTADWNHLKRGQGCPKCKGRKISEAKTYTFDDFVRKSKEVHGEKYEYPEQEYKGSDQPIKVLCKKHGEFKVMPYKHIAGHGCPYCSSSHMEDELYGRLVKCGMKVERQKRFDWLKTGKFSSQSLDFYLPDYNVAIECQGEQHFKPVDFGEHGDVEETFRHTVELDERKRKLCLEHGIKLLYFSDNNERKEFLGEVVFNNSKEIIETILR